jgi:hypothetical protein
VSGYDDDSRLVETPGLDEEAAHGNRHLETPVSPIIEALRARRAEKAEQHFHDEEVPGYGGLLVLRLGALPGNALTELRLRLERSRSPDRESNMNADVIAKATRAVLGRARVDDELVELPGHDGPVRMDAELAEILGIDAKTARQVVFAVFEKANAPDIALAATAASYLEWATSAADEADEELLGES